MTTDSAGPRISQTSGARQAAALMPCRLRFQPDIERLGPWGHSWRRSDPPIRHTTSQETPMKQILLALAALPPSAPPSRPSPEGLGTRSLPRHRSSITILQADKRQVMLNTLALAPMQLEKFTPVYDEYEAEMKKLMTSASNLNNRLFVADLGGMHEPRGQGHHEAGFQAPPGASVPAGEVRRQARKRAAGNEGRPVRPDRQQDPALLDVAVAASIPLVTKAPNTNP